MLDTLHPAGMEACAPKLLWTTRYLCDKVALQEYEIHLLKLDVKLYASNTDFWKSKVEALEAENKQLIRGCQHYFILSDDPDWCKECTLNFRHPVHTRVDAA